MKSPISIAVILAFITCSNGQTLRTSSEERVLLASVSDSTKMGNEEYHLSSDHTQGLSSGMDSKSHVNDISSRIQHGDIHEDVKSPKEMAMSKIASCFSNAEKRESEDPTEAEKCAQIIAEVSAYCKKTRRVSSRKTPKRQLMENFSCGHPNTYGRTHCPYCYSNGFFPEIHTQVVGYPAHPPPYQQMTQDQSHSNYQGQSYGYGQPNSQPRYRDVFPREQIQAYVDAAENGNYRSTNVVEAPPQRGHHRSESPSPRRSQEQVEMCCYCCSQCGAAIHSCTSYVACCCIIAYVCDTCTDCA